MLSKLAVSDIKPFDYAEHFESNVLPSVAYTTLLAARDQTYLSDPAFPRRGEAAHLLMWRQAPSIKLNDPYREAVTEIIGENAALFVERYSILRSRT